MGVNAVFKKAQDLEYITCAIPKQREPEFGVIYEDMADHQTIYNGLARRDDIEILSRETTPEHRYLASLAEDTVDEEGHPTQLIRGLKLERRRRSSLYPADNSFRRHDISYKDALKSSFRREWDSASNCLRSGEEGITAKLTRDIPAASVINPENLRVSSICLTSRASYEVLHHLPKHHASIVYEVCNDACVFTSPHADHILGYRKETELEAKEIRLYAPDDMSDERLNRLLDVSINMLEPYVSKLKYKGLVQSASISKVCHANEMARMHYADTAETMHMDGHQWALIQNVRAWDYMANSRRAALSRLGETLPPAELLVPEAKTRLLKGFFPDSQKYPPFPTLGQ